MRRPRSAVALGVLLLLVLPATAHAAMAITEFPLPPSSDGWGPVTAAAGGVWFTEPNANAVGRIGPGGRVTIYPLPPPHQDPRGIATGPDGAAWFTETGGYSRVGGIGRIGPSGTITEFSLPDGVSPFGITTGPDGNIWFTKANLWWRIGMMTPAGEVTIFPAQTHNRPMNIVKGPDGALWFTEDGIVYAGSGAIGRITTSGTMSEYLLPTPSGFFSGAWDITVGPDGNLWFTWVQWELLERGPAEGGVGRITPSGTLTRWTTATSGGWPPFNLTAGPDGKIWFTEGANDVLGSITMTGDITTYALPSTGTYANDIAVRGGNELWFMEPGTNMIARLRLHGSGRTRGARAVPTYR